MRRCFISSCMLKKKKKEWPYTCKQEIHNALGQVLVCALLYCFHTLSWDVSWVVRNHRKQKASLFLHPSVKGNVYPYWFYVGGSMQQLKTLGMWEDKKGLHIAWPKTWVCRATMLAEWNYFNQMEKKIGTIYTHQICQIKESTTRSVRRVPWQG